MLAINLPGSCLRSWLIAPVMGFSLQILIVSIINQAGYPVEKFARWEAVLTLLIAIAIFLWKRPIFPWRYLSPFAGSSLIVLFYAGWPLLLLGMGWLSYCNDDMANYCLAAKRHLHHGFFSVPTIEELQGTDYSQYYYFMHVGGFLRYGSELLISWVSGVTGLNPLKIFMPTIIALGMGLPPITAALARAGRAKYAVMVVSSLLLALSPLFLLGMFYQLIAQMAGLGLLCGTATLMMDERKLASKQSFLRMSLGLGTLGAAFCVTYPELTPFCGLGFLLWIVVRSIKSLSIPWSKYSLNPLGECANDSTHYQGDPSNLNQGINQPPTSHLLPFTTIRPVGRIVTSWRPIVLCLLSGVVVLTWLRYNIFVYLLTIIEQLQGGTHAMESDILFPYFLVPSGIPSLFGFLSISGSFSKIQGYGLMFISIIFLILFTGLVMHSIRKGKGHSCIALIMLLVGGLLFYKQVGFGTFKLAMFIQPFIAIELALFFCSLGLMQLLVWVVFYCIFQFPVGFFYGKTSLGLHHAQFVEIPGASSRNLDITNRENFSVVSVESAHLVIEKFAACVAQGHPLVFNMKNSIAEFGAAAAPPFFLDLIARFHLYVKETASVSDLVKENMMMFQEKKLLGTSIKYSLRQQDTTATRVRPPRDIEIFNGLLSNNEIGKDFFQSTKLLPEEVSLTFVNSHRGEHYYGCFKRKAISFYQNQNDPYSRVQSLSGIGPYFLFQVDPPSQEIYLRVAVTKSIFGKERTSLYQHAVVKGEQDKNADFKGNGAANLYIGPIKPFDWNGTSYVALDFGEEGQQPIKDTTGIMGLYRKEQSIDPRYLVGYARDISAITADHYRIMERPREVSNFPKDLAEAKSLEFSGWYEDGWISQHSYVILGSDKKADSLVIKGVVPGLKRLVTEGQRITIFINGVEICHQQKIAPGAFELKFNVPQKKESSPSTRVDIVFNIAEQLPAPDFRPASAKINYLGLN
ncbi:MAG TPA: hypothetical protein VJK54_11455 [Chthoniobacterales bacterium]|nr:hypothetical protein [Chthoniobacterales bacterium]